MLSRLVRNANKKLMVLLYVLDAATTVISPVLTLNTTEAILGAVSASLRPHGAVYNLKQRIFDNSGYGLSLNRVPTGRKRHWNASSRSKQRQLQRSS